MKAQLEYVHVMQKFLARFGADLHAQSVLSSKISASELRRKFIKSALLVGYAGDVGKDGLPPQPNDPCKRAQTFAKLFFYPVFLLGVGHALVTIHYFVVTRPINHPLFFLYLCGGALPLP